MKPPAPESSLRCYRMTVAYDGTSYAGWQRQSEEPTIQAALEDALAQVTGEAITVTGSGRTDAGVHAVGQVAAFGTKSDRDAATLHRALNALTPEDIHVRDCRAVSREFHPIRDALGKRYRYLVQHGPSWNPIRRRESWSLQQPLDVGGMQAAAACLRGRHDFSAFEASGAPRASSVREVRELSIRAWREDEVDWIAVEVEADGFLYNMVRNIVGTLVEVGQGRRPAPWAREVLDSRDRRSAGPTAPPHGLCLIHVRYDDEKWML